jgi:hypothetical protein
MALELAVMDRKLTPIDIGILVAAVVMAVGAFCPIVRLPIVGTVNYFMGGRGDGIFIVGCAAVIVGLLFAGYRRTTGVLAAGTLFLMILSLVRFATELWKAQASMARDSGPLKGLSMLIANSVGLEWGWLLLIGGALAIVVLALMPSGIIPVPGERYKSQDDQGDNFASADEKIAAYLENRKLSPSLRAQSTPNPTGFGKRGAI